MLPSLPLSALLTHKFSVLVERQPLVDNQTTPEIIYSRYSYHCKIPNATPKRDQRCKSSTKHASNV
jgi:hypothetical protein